MSSFYISQSAKPYRSIGILIQIFLLLGFVRLALGEQHSVMTKPDGTESTSDSGNTVNKMYLTLIGWVESGCVGKVYLFKF